MIDIYIDCANLEQMREAVKNPIVKGFTTNPTLMATGGVKDYEAFAKDALQIVDGLPISFEVFADELDEMEKQARKIASWGSNVNVKIPVTNTKGESSENLIVKLTNDEIKCNVTAIFGVDQAIDALLGINTPGCIISIFAGRMADTGIDPSDDIKIIVGAALWSETKVLWASSREVLNIYQADMCCCDIITVTPDLLAKYESFRGKDFTEFSLDTVKMFYEDAQKSGFTL